MNESGRKNLHEQVLYTQVRIHSAKAGGSGTVLYSGKQGNIYNTYVLTCHHVIEGSLSVRKEYDPKIGMDTKKEFRQVVNVEFFDYDMVPHGRRPVSNSVDADIVAYDKPHDMALLKLRTIREVPFIADLLPKKQIEGIKIGDDSFAVGCALLHDPILTKGMITHMGDEIDYKDYWMSSAQIIFGNSGGAMFYPKGDDFFFIGIPSRIAISGWSDAITHLGYFSPIPRVYQFFEEEHYEFIYDPNFTEEQCEKLREARRQKAEQFRVPLESGAPTTVSDTQTADPHPKGDNES